MKYLAFVILLAIVNVKVNAKRYTNKQIIDLNKYDSSEDAETVRIVRSANDEDYSDEGGFIGAPGHSGDDDFITNVRDCADGNTRTPWGKCISCAEYKKKFRRIGMGC